MVNLDGNVRQTVNLSFRDRARGVLENLVKATLNSRQHTEDMYLIYETRLILLYFQNLTGSLMDFNIPIIYRIRIKNYIVHSRSYVARPP